jgi:hypothetical protein
LPLEKLALELRQTLFDENPFERGSAGSQIDAGEVLNPLRVGR